MFPLLLNSTSVITGAAIVAVIVLLCLGLYIIYKKTREGRDSDTLTGGGSNIGSGEEHGPQQDLQSK